MDGLFYSQFSFLHIVPNTTRQDKNIIFKIVSVRAVSFSGKELVSLLEPRQMEPRWMEPRRIGVLTVATLQVLASRPDLMLGWGEGSVAELPVPALD